MAKLDIEIPHQLRREEALDRIQGMLRKLQEEQKDTIRNVSEKWEGNEGEFSFSAKGFDLSGKIRVEENAVNIIGELPFALSFFKSQISRVIQDKAGALLSS
ncbi:MAG TPA: polyhydroxyalkanoic acid system family protein [Chitinophagaceae bacterium]|nr:polyhydroxyalkanoic acid system family protein [Chitinophagaceae bacterium]